MRVSRVFAPQQPMRYDQRIGDMIPSMDLSPAEEYGDLRIVLPWIGKDAMIMSHPVVKRIREALKDYSDEDYLLAVGDPGAIMVLGAVAAEFNRGRFRVLKWDRRANRYVSVTYDVTGGSV